MQVSELMTQLREDYLDDTLGIADNDSLVSEAALIRFANDAQQQATRRGDNLIYDESSAICTITLIADQDNYSFDSSIKRINRVSIDGTDLTFKTEYDLDQMDASWRSTDSGTPLYYYVRGREIFVHPKPDATVALETLDLAVRRTALPVTLSTDEFEIPAELQPDLIYWMLYRVYNKRDEDLFDPNNAALYLQMFKDVFGEIIPADVRSHQLESDRRLQHTHGSYTHTGDSSGDPDFDARGW